MTHQLKLEVITPVHVGMGMEKKLLKGLDFVIDEKEGVYRVLNNDSILSNLERREIEIVSNYLAAGDFEAFSSFLNKRRSLIEKMTRYTWKSNFRQATEIRQVSIDGDGKYYIPGSAIKGALRSIILTSLWNGRNGDINTRHLMGGIENNLMRYLQVTDCYVDEKPGIYPVKVFSADMEKGQKIGKWKDRSNGGHEEEFNNNRFVNHYEMLPDGLNRPSATGEFRLNWGGYEFLKKQNRNITPNLEKVFDQSVGIDYLFHSARKITQEHIQKEIEFFDIYQNWHLGEDFFNELHWLLEQNTEPSCLVRIGANVGWHSITGNWKFKSHVEAVEKNRGYIVGGRERAFKTRKIGFDHDENAHVRFFLPGFIKITLT
jgi:hypothetical protein